LEDLGFWTLPTPQLDLGKKKNIHWVGLRENLKQTPIFNGKNHGFL
jgi:hypothetical protein